MTIWIPITVLVLGVVLAIVLALLVSGGKRSPRGIALSISIGLLLILETIATAKILTQPQTSLRTVAEHEPELSQTTHPAQSVEIDLTSTPSVAVQHVRETPEVPAGQKIQPTSMPTTSADKHPIETSEQIKPPSTAVPVAQTPTVDVSDSPEYVVQRLAETEAALQSGEISAVVDLGKGTEAQAVIRFDLGTNPSDARLHIHTIYRSEVSSQAIDYIAIGDKHWQRIGEGAWDIATGHGAMENILMYLPLANRVTGLVEYDAGRLQWTDTLRGSDIVVTLDPVTGVPVTMQRRTQASGLELKVVYTGWNTPVDILVPVAP